MKECLHKQISENGSDTSTARYLLALIFTLLIQPVCNFNNLFILNRYFFILNNANLLIILFINYIYYYYIEHRFIPAK